MSQDRSAAANLLSVFFFVAAVFVGIDRAARAAELGEWALPLLLLLIGLGLLAYQWAMKPSSLAAESPEAIAIQTWENESPASRIAPPPGPPQPMIAEPVGKTPPAARAGEPDDLKVIEGIGPKMAAALAAAGIDTYAKLAQTSEDDLRAAVQAAGMRLAPSLPTWAEQARFASQGDWDGLKAFQATLKGGRKQ
jgi:predicted flap endonuclease-1-like 5' DNA nuclease